MIISDLYVYSLISKELLKKYRFNTCGISIILGVKKEEATDSNGVGKTSMVESIKFLLGGSIPDEFNGNVVLSQKDIFLILKVKYNGEIIFLGRRINEKDNGYILESDQLSIQLDDWKLFNDKQYKQRIQEYVLGSYINTEIPTFSSIREYIIRDEKHGFGGIALDNRGAIQNYRILAFLCGLPHEAEREIKKLKAEQRKLNQKLNFIKTISTEISELKIEEKKLMGEIKKLNNIIERVNINDKIVADEQKYEEAKIKLNKVQASIFESEHIKDQYRKNIENLKEKLEQIKLLGDIKPFYEQLMNYFPDELDKNYNEIVDFYNFMVDSRGKYFKDKIDKLDIKIKTLYKERKVLQDLIEESSQVFKNQKFISDINSIIEEVNKKNAILAEIRLKINYYEQKKEINEKINDIKSQIIKMTEVKQQEFNDKNDIAINMSSIFEIIVQETYNEQAVLEFDFDNRTDLNDTTGRIKIKSSIEDEGSHGRLYMKINMFDLACLFNRLNFRLPLEFLIHDGSYSKPDDKYAKARLFNYVHRELNVIGRGQYIITINIDELNSDDIEQFKKQGFIIAELDRNCNNENRFFGFKY